MGAATKPVSAQCLCGRVTFTVTPHDLDVGVCHCAMCRRWTAGAFMALHCEDVDIPENDALGVYRSSDWAERGFCKECGTPLFWRTHDHSMYAVSATAVEISEGLRLATEIFIEEKPQYYAFANDTRKMTGAEVMAMFAEDREA